MISNGVQMVSDGILMASSGILMVSSGNVMVTNASPMAKFHIDHYTIRHSFLMFFSVLMFFFLGNLRGKSCNIFPCELLPTSMKNFHPLQPKPLRVAG